MILHNSVLSVDSKLGKGSEFSFKLLLEKSEIFKPIENTAVKLSPLDILVVEDYSLNALIIKKMLSSWGMNVTTVESGKEAIAIILKDNFNLIFMDIHMPEMDGIETTKRIKAMDQYSNIPVYHCSPTNGSKI